MFADNIADCLPDVGAEPVRLGTLRPRPNSRRLAGVADAFFTGIVAADQAFQRRVADRAMELECDVVITVEGATLPATVERLAEAKIPTVLWFPDHVANIARQLMLIAPYKRVYFTDRMLVERLTALTEVPAAYLPEACNPRWHAPPPTEPAPDPVLVVAGNFYPSRVRLLDRLIADGVPLRLYGTPFARWIPNRPVMSAHTHRWIARHEKAAVFRAAAGVLNNLHPAENGANCRLFEATACGAAVLVEDRPAVQELFDPSTELFTFSDYEQLLHRCRLLLADPESSRLVKDAAARRAHADHTYQHRLSSILADVAP
ncbi:MAG TPA: glycosyltransferase [Mycobacteriales bacterium]|nr:glycosyltransferase [Mycobacteriales bacterium]